MIVVLLFNLLFIDTTLIVSFIDIVIHPGTFAFFIVVLMLETWLLYHVFTIATSTVAFLGNGNILLKVSKLVIVLIKVATLAQNLLIIIFIKIFN